MLFFWICHKFKFVFHLCPSLLTKIIHIFYPKVFYPTDPKVNTDAKKLQGGSWSILPQKMLKIRCLRLVKNTFAIQHLLHHSIVYYIVHLYNIAIKMMHLQLHF
jgi:hypothetical protein